MVDNRNKNKNKIPAPPSIRWTNKNSMAWRAFYYFIVGTILYWFVLPLWFSYFDLNYSWLEIIGDSFIWFAFTMSSIILGYFGFTTLPFMGTGKKVVTSPEEENLQQDDETDDNEVR